MSDATHTKGPWEIIPEKIEHKVWLWVMRAHKRICRVVLYEGDELEDEANARLIAAAPDLLEACQQLLKADDAQSRAWAREAIRKAVGDAA